MDHLLGALHALSRRPLALLAAGWGSLAAATLAVSLLAASPRAAGAGGDLRVLPEVPVTANVSPGRAQNSPVMAADPKNSRVMFIANRIDAPAFSCELEVSGDGGRSWVEVHPVPRLPPGAERCYAPEIAFDGAGRVYYLFVALHGLGNSPVGVFLTTSSDEGRTFSAPRQVLGPDRYQVRMAIDPTGGSQGRLHLVWLEAGSSPPTGGLPPTPNPIVSAYSDDGGATFSRPVQVSDPKRARVVAPALALGPDHTVDILYYDLRRDARDYEGLEGPAWDGRWSLVFTSSRDGGRSFAPGRVVDDRLVPPGRVMLIYTMPPPALAVDGAGRLFAAWHDDRNGDWDVFLSRSNDGGRSWARSRRLNDDRVGNGRSQYLPALSVAPNGRLDAIFYDRRNDPQNLRNDVYMTSSTDHGVSFTPNVKLTSESSDSRSGQSYLVVSARGLVDFGSRIAVLSRNTTLEAAWTDTRNAETPPYQDVFATEVEFAQAAIGSSTAWWVALGLGCAALLNGALVGMVLYRRRPRLRLGARRLPLASAAVLTVAGVVACGSRNAYPPRPAELDVTMKEYAFEHAPSVPRGRVVFRLSNTGRLYHQLTLVRIPAGFPPINVQLHSNIRRPVPTLFLDPPLAPGAHRSFAIDLPPGRYAMLSYLRDPQQPHGPVDALKGMNSEIHVR